MGIFPKDRDESGWKEKNGWNHHLVILSSWALQISAPFVESVPYPIPTSLVMTSKTSLRPMTSPPPCPKLNCDVNALGIHPITPKRSLGGSTNVTGTSPSPCQLKWYINPLFLFEIAPLALQGTNISLPKDGKMMWLSWCLGKGWQNIWVVVEMCYMLQGVVGDDLYIHLHENIWI